MCGVLSPVLLVVDVDDLIKKLNALDMAIA